MRRRGAQFVEIPIFRYPLEAKFYFAPTGPIRSAVLLRGALGKESIPLQQSLSHIEIDTTWQIAKAEENANPQHDRPLLNRTASRCRALF